MATRPTRAQELRPEKSELSRIWGLYSILESCQSRANPKLISNGRPPNKHIIDDSRKPDQLTSFDEECRRIQKEAELASVKVDATERSMRNLIQEDIYRQIVVKGQQLTEADSELVGCPVEPQKPARTKSIKAYELWLCNLSNAASLIHQQQPSTSAEISKEIIIKQAQMSAKAFVDQMFIDRKFICKERTTSESKPFSDALKVLNINKDLFMEFLPEPNSLYHYTKTGFTAQPSDKIVILKPASQTRTYSGNIASRCSSRQHNQKQSITVSNGKPKSFSFRQILQKKLKHRFGGTRKEPNQLSMDCTLPKFSQNSSNFGADCRCCGADTSNPLNSSTNVKRKEKLGKKGDLIFNSVCDSIRKKIDFSSVRLSEKEKVDVVLEAKWHLSERLRNLNAVGTPTRKRSLRTLGRILSSPEHEFWPLSPIRDNQYFSGFSQTRFSSYSSSPCPNGRQRTCLSALRANTEVTSCDDYEEYDDKIEILGTETSSSLIRSTDEAAHYTIISAIDNKKSNGQPMIVELKSIRHSETNSTDVTRRTETIDLNKEGRSIMHPISDSLSDDFPSTPPSIYQLDMPENIKYQEEHRSPVSVLEQFFAEDANSPSTNLHQTGPFAAKQPLQPRRQLHFEECLSDSSPQDQPLIPANPCITEQDYISHYVYLVLQASCLNWDQLSKIRRPSQELLHSSLFDEVEFLRSDSHFEPKLLFDHINEVLLKIHQSHFRCSRSRPWLAFVKPRITSAPLEDLVVDEIMREAADFYLLSRTEQRTLNQLVAKDVADSRLWLDVRVQTEHIIIHVSEDMLQELILDVILGFHS